MTAPVPMQKCAVWWSQVFRQHCMERPQLLLSEYAAEVKAGPECVVVARATGSGSEKLSQGGATVAPPAHNPEVAGATPAPAFLWSGRGISAEVHQNAEEAISQKQMPVQVRPGSADVVNKTPRISAPALCESQTPLSPSACALSVTGAVGV